MPTAISLTESQIFTALTTVLSGMIPGIAIIRGQDNRVPEPVCPDFIEMWPLMRTRLSMNVDTPDDCTFVGSITGNALTVSDLTFGAIQLGAQVFGVSVAPNTIVTGLSPYTVTPSQTVASANLAAGTRQIEQSTRMTVQLDVHGPSSGDNAQIITTLFRDGYGVEAFEQSGYPIAPLYTNEPRQLAFDNGEDQFEDRWSIDLDLQIKPVIGVPQQFADQLTATVDQVQALSA
jgi:hypothetical protein